MIIATWANKLMLMCGKVVIHNDTFTASDMIENRPSRANKVVKRSAAWLGAASPP